MNLLSDAKNNAQALDQVLSWEIRAFRLEAAKKLFLRIRTYLVEQSRSLHKLNDVKSIIKFKEPDSLGFAVITAGPTFDKGPSEAHINFESGSRLSFSIMIKEESGASELIAFRFHHHFANGHSPAYLRFDLNKAQHQMPLAEPRCHLHPGIEDIRLPMPILHPIHILDRIFFVIEGKN